jgi:hypothetical protein
MSIDCCTTDTLPLGTLLTFLKSLEVSEKLFVAGLPWGWKCRGYTIYK